MNDLTMLQQITSSRLRMTSREIAELAGKRHDHVLRDIDNLLKTLPSELGTGFSMAYEGSPENGYRYFLLDRDSAYCLMAGYDPVARMRVIKRWQELETTLCSAPPSQNPQERLQELQAAQERGQRILTRVKALIASTDEGEYWFTESCSAALDQFCSGAEALREQVQAALDRITDEQAALDGTRRSGPALTYRP